MPASGHSNGPAGRLQAPNIRSPGVRLGDTQARMSGPRELSDPTPSGPLPWPSRVAATSGDLHIVEQALAWVPDDVASALRERLAEDAWWGRTAIHCLALAGTAGARAVSMGDNGQIELLGPEGRPYVLAVCMLDEEPEHAAGRPEDVDRVRETLCATFGDQGFILYLRRPIPADFDVDPLARAVHLWLAAVERGEWNGSHAVYEDDDVAVELTLTGQSKPEGGSALLFTVGPVRSLERLAALDKQLLSQLEESEDDGTPWIFALGNRQDTRPSRGYIEQLLYGTAEVVVASGEAQPQYEATFASTGRALLQDEACSRLSSIWWIEPSDTHATGFFSRAFDNPWALPLAPLSVSGARFRQTSSEEGSKGAVLGWTLRGPTLWEAQP